MAIRVSVVIPSFKRPDLLSRCLAALVVQEFDPASYEVVVADDAASVETQYLVESWAEWGEQRGGPRFCYLPVGGPKHGPAAARNRGWQGAQGEIIAFIDDDCIPAPNWLRSGMAAFSDGVVAVSGQVVVPVDKKPSDYERNTQSLMTAEFITANAFCKCEALSALGGFDERFTLAWREDSDLVLTLLEQGRRIVFAPDTIVVHPIRPARWGVSLQHQRRNFFNPLLYKKHPRLYSRWVQASPRARYYSILGALLLALVTALRGPRRLALLASAIWLGLTGQFAAERLARTAHTPRHIAEMIVTSALIPPLSIYWRLRGAIHWRVWYW